ncbi:MAG: type II toxin-antitoxin system HicA family toxin [Actinomycetota bacterium]|nr:type II toxin-antitoxin system HicA family toxin [Actinomycetota bacterium]MDQ3429056.1 type II toxin-antitoxin system HicA family toxin [Actinomycetota bacterium]
MPRLPACSGTEAVGAFERLGYEQARQRGSHVFLKCGGRKSLSVPLHDQLKSGTLRGLVRDSGFSVETFSDAL